MTDLPASYGYLLLTGLCAIAFTAAIGFSVAIGFGLEAALRPRRTIFSIPLKTGQYRWELVGNIRFIVMAAFSFAGLFWIVPIASGEGNSLGRAGLTFFFCWIGFEVYYWCIHRVMHLPQFYKYHRYHHESRVGTPLTGYSMSTVESLGWLVGLVGVPLLLGQFIPISLGGLIAYHLSYQIPGNVIGHANVDFFPAAAHGRIGSWISHPIVYHALHHARFNNHYSFGSSFMDRLIGTEWDDWPALHARVIAGNPMKKLSEQGATNSQL